MEIDALKKSISNLRETLDLAEQEKAQLEQNVRKESYQVCQLRESSAKLRERIDRLSQLHEDKIKIKSLRTK